MSKLEPKYPNSAGRLLAILDSVKSNVSFIDQLGPLFFDKKQIQKDIAHNSVLGVDVIVQLHLVYGEFVKDLANADIPDEEKNVLINGLSSLKSMMYPVNSGQNMRAVSDAEKALLEVCATRLPKENVISDNDVELIKSSIEALKDSIHELPSDSILRTVLLELVRLSEDSINRFNIYGSKGLKKAFKNMLAEVAEIYLQDEEDVSQVKDTTAWTKAKDHLQKFDAVAAKAMKYKPLIEKASGYLLG